MASSGKKKTTMAKLTRESRLRERRLDKQAKKDARRQAARDPGRSGDTLNTTIGESARPGAGQPTLETVTANKRADVASTDDRAAELREGAAEDRASAADDRLRAAQERAESVHDRKQASSERVQAAKDREASETDELTHVRRRGAGLAQLQREIDRARRAPEELVVTFSDVDGLKKVNDTMGHLAGDRLLIAVADSLRAGLRSYDLIMRFGGDEFVCALPNMSIRDAHRRFADISKALAEGPTGGSISVGFATLGESDSAETLIHRADEDLLARRASP